MTSASVPQPSSSKNNPVKTATTQPESPKHLIPIWMIFLVLFLLSLVVGMGIYIGNQNGLFRNFFATEQASLSLTPTPMKDIPSITPGADWKTYEDTNTGFRLKYPPDVLLNGEGKGATQNILSIYAESIDAIPEELPLGKGRKDAILDRESLQKGVAQTVGDFAASDALVRIGNTYNGRMTSVLSRFEICSVILSRSLVYYPGNFRVTISLAGAEDPIMTSMPEFFTVDPTNCGEMTMWNRDIMGTFLPTLAKGQGKGAAQVWYDTFTAIIKTIELIPASGVVASATPSPTIAQPCEVTDGAFCNVLSDIKQSMEAKNYAGVIAYQTPMTVTCDPDGMAVTICEGAPKGTIKEGYGIGFNESEGTVLSREQLLSSITSYISNNGPFIYKGSLQAGDKGVIVYLNAEATDLFVLYMKRMGSTWRFESILEGGTFGNSSFANLSPSLLDNVQ